jgi:prophage antirepressor-like protein
MEHKENGQLTLVDKKYEFNGKQLTIFEKIIFDKKKNKHKKELWYIAKEVARTFGKRDIQKQLQGIKSSWKEVTPIRGHLGGTQNTIIINQSALYKIILRMQGIPIVEEFQDWLCEEVIPSIMETGSYQSPGINNQLLIESKEQIERLRNENVGLLNERTELKENLERTEEKLKKYVKSSRVITNNRNKIKISQRVIFLSELHNIHGISGPLHYHIMKKHRWHGYEAVHPDKWEYMAKLTQMSKKMSKAYKNRHGDYCEIDTSTRRNTYTEPDYLMFGDSIILQFLLQEDPPIQWGFRFDGNLEGNSVEDYDEYWRRNHERGW